MLIFGICVLGGFLAVGLYALLRGLCDAAAPRECATRCGREATVQQHRSDGHPVWRCAECAHLVDTYRAELPFARAVEDTAAQSVDFLRWDEQMEDVT